MAMIKYTNAKAERRWFNSAHIVSIAAAGGKAVIELTTKELVSIEAESVDRIIREINGEFI